MLDSADVELARAIERCEVPAGGFPHASHLRVAWVYLNESASVDEATGRMAATLRRFAASVGQAEKYSDPITAFWMYQMAAVRALMPFADLDAVLRAHPRLLDTHVIRTEADHVSPSRSAHPSSDAPDRPVPGRPA